MKTRRKTTLLLLNTLLKLLILAASSDCCSNFACKQCDRLRSGQVSPIFPGSSRCDCQGFSSPSSTLLLFRFSFLCFEDELLPEAGDLVEFGDSSASCTKCASESILFFKKIGVLNFKRFFLLLTLTV